MVGASDEYDYDCWNCPCATHPGPPPPAFVENHYYCESGAVGTVTNASFYISDALWDGTGYTRNNECCAQIGMPWFFRKLPVCVAENFEVRIVVKMRSL